MTITVGVIGIHGFSRQHLTQFLARQALGECRIVAAVAHQRELDPAYAASLEAHGIRLVPDLDALLALDIQLISVPLGIHLHAPVAERCLRAGRDVYLEKPIAATVAEVETLARAERDSGRTLIIGFQDLFQPGLWHLRDRLAAGDWGTVRQITITVGWPRARAYYARNAWAGKIRLGDGWVRDSIANNACAHFLNVGVFLAGQPLAVTAELGRGYAIESFDTCSLRVDTARGIPVVFNATHLGTSEFGPRVRIDCERGVIENTRLEDGQPWRLPDGSEIAVPPRHAQPYRETLAHLRGESATICRLPDCRAHTAVIEAAHLGCPIADLPGLIADTDKIVHPRIDEALVLAHQRGCTLGETGLIPGLAPGRKQVTTGA